MNIFSEYVMDMSTSRYTRLHHEMQQVQRKNCEHQTQTSKNKKNQEIENDTRVRTGGCLIPKSKGLMKAVFVHIGFGEGMLNS